MRFCAIGLVAGMTAALALSASASAGPAPRATNDAAATTDVDWPHFRFDEKHTGYQPFETTITKKNAKFLGLEWQAQLGDLVFSSSPAVVGGVVYIGTTDGTLWAYPADGCGSDYCDTPLWSSTYLAQIVDSPTVANGIVYVGSQTDFNSNDGKLNAFSADGCGQAVCAPLWQGDSGPDSILESSPTVANGLVYVGSFAGTLYAFNAEGCGQALCQPVWFAQTGGSVESSPLVYKGVVYIGSDDGKLYAFKAKGCRRSPCKALWTGDLGNPIFESSPAISKGLVYISSQHSIAAFDAAGCGAATCSPLWQSIDNQNFFNGSPAIAYGRVYIGLEAGLAVYDAAGCGQQTCNKLWSLFGSGAQAVIASSPTVANGVVYAGRNTGEVLAWRADSCGQSSCNEIWKGRTEDPIVNSSPTIVNGKLYIGSSDQHFPESISGRIYVYDLQL
ncbi:MAG TPA: PQQ-binding-like beta-propeller repeat protein [Rhizomicrobium sp.]